MAEDGDPERDIIMWMDHRAADETAAINATGDPALAYVGGEVSIEMELPKVLWLQRHCPDRYRAAARFFDLADYLVWRCCGADTASVCTLTCKWNYLAHEGRFPEAMLRAVGLGDLGARLPQRVLPLGSSPGTLTAAAARDLGLPASVIVATGIIDAHAGGLALIGTRPEGSLALIGGTSNCHMVVSPQPDHGARRLGTVLRCDAARHLAQRRRPERRGRAARLDAAPERRVAAGAGDGGARGPQRLRGAERLGRPTSRRARRCPRATCTCCPITTAIARRWPIRGPAAP